MQTAADPNISAELRRRLDTAQRVLVLTGAGVSAESGVPTFRGGGNSAVWKGLPFDVISSGAMLERNGKREVAELRFRWRVGGELLHVDA